jgi:hypothetical protein
MAGRVCEQAVTAPAAHTNITLARSARARKKKRRLEGRVIRRLRSTTHPPTFVTQRSAPDFWDVLFIVTFGLVKKHHALLSRDAITTSR